MLRKLSINLRCDRALVVKTRTSDVYGRPSEAVVSAKQRRYRRIAQFYWLETGKEPNARFDVVEVWADGKVEHYKYAF